MQATLIIIGNEILSGDVLDTNSHFISKNLSKIGIKTYQKFTIVDNIKQIKKSIKIAVKDSDFIFTTGGLGPTKDDVTKKAICSFLNDKLILNDLAYNHIKFFLKTNDKKINKFNKNQALVPSKSEIIINEVGTAPCLWNNINNKILICLPGVPYETKKLITNQIIPLIKKKFKLPYIISKEVLLTKIPESILAEKLITWEKKLNKNIELSYIPLGSNVKIKLTQTGKNKKKIENNLQKQLIYLYKRLDQ